MGQTVSWLSNFIWAKKEIRILILGLVRIPVSPFICVLKTEQLHLAG
jgi:hypothetical protein